MRVCGARRVVVPKARGGTVIVPSRAEVSRGASQCANGISRLSSGVHALVFVWSGRARGCRHAHLGGPEERERHTRDLDQWWYSAKNPTSSLLSVRCAT